MQKITIKQLKEYFKNDLQMQPKHNLKACKYAFNELNKEINTDVFNLVYLIFENKECKELQTHSYDFHTRNGRYLIETFKELYYKMLKRIINLTF